MKEKKLEERIKELETQLENQKEIIKILYREKLVRDSNKGGTIIDKKPYKYGV